MGGSSRGNFGNTTGSFLDTISNILSVASFIPGLDTFTNLASIPVYVLRGDWLSAGLDIAGMIPFAGEIADTANVTRKVDKAIDSVKASDKVIKSINNPVVKAKRVGNAKKLDKYHDFSSVIDNYVGKANKFKLRGGDGKTRTLYQIKGSLNGKDGIFEWILDNTKGTTHRRFIEGGKITGIPNAK